MITKILYRETIDALGNKTGWRKDNLHLKESSDNEDTIQQLKDLNIDLKYGPEQTKDGQYVYYGYIRLGDAYTYPRFREYKAYCNVKVTF